MSELDLMEFIAKLGKAIIASDAITGSVLREAGKIVQREAKAELGHYQDAAGSFVAWAELADSTKAQRVSLGYTENDPGVRSGDMRDSIEVTVNHDLLTGEAQIGSDKDEMVWFEIGTSKQPPRSALGGALYRKTPEVVELIGSSAFGALMGRGVYNGAIPIISESD
ncbi:MAG: hypothetical protein KGI54_16175 [Pseudomonadota bacterium]|nr:hypothetical protein [Pseudomonadota bacterium]